MESAEALRKMVRVATLATLTSVLFILIWRLIAGEVPHHSCEAGPFLAFSWWWDAAVMPVLVALLWGSAWFLWSEAGISPPSVRVVTLLGAVTIGYILGGILGVVYGCAGGGVVGLTVFLVVGLVGGFLTWLAIAMACEAVVLIWQIVSGGLGGGWVKFKAWLKE